MYRSSTFGHTFGLKGSFYTGFPILLECQPPKGPCYKGEGRLRVQHTRLGEAPQCQSQLVSQEDAIKSLFYDDLQHSALSDIFVNAHHLPSFALYEYPILHRWEIVPALTYGDTTVFVGFSSNLLSSVSVSLAAYMFKDSINPLQSQFVPRCYSPHIADRRLLEGLCI
jgi:hypothetical protein